MIILSKFHLDNLYKILDGNIFEHYKKHTTILEKFLKHLKINN